ncbi:MAG TPA: cell wall hydrolase [Sphingomicrobium sp.]|nr:cell wall hydrolase [Sphingomicrobium sp.]
MKLGALMTRRRGIFATAGVAGAAVAASAIGAWIVVSGPAAATPDLSPIPPTRAAALVDATSGPSSEQLRAVGDEAKLINAALPFSQAPVAAARPFYLSGDPTDQKRALLCLTQAVYYEAGFEPAEGRRAVAQVVLNRLRHPAFPKSVCGVVYQGSNSGVCQFTFVCDGALYREPEAGAWRQARAIAQAALAGYVERSVGEATHYHADYVAPRWAPMLAKVAQIGAHIFYRWPGAWGQPQAFVGRYIGEPSDPMALRPARLVLAVANAAAPTVEAGPPVPRAPNDVGGLLDTTKGWTLSIPDPRETRGASSEVLAAQEAKPAQPVVVASAGPATAAAR